MSVKSTFTGNGDSKVIQGKVIDLDITGTWAGTITAKRSLDEGVTWSDLFSTTINDSWVIENGKSAWFKLTMSSYSSGTATYVYK